MLIEPSTKPNYTCIICDKPVYNKQRIKRGKYCRECADTVQKLRDLCWHKGIKCDDPFTEQIIVRHYSMLAEIKEAIDLLLTSDKPLDGVIDQYVNSIEGKLHKLSDITKKKRGEIK